MRRDISKATAVLASLVTVSMGQANAQASGTSFGDNSTSFRAHVAEICPVLGQSTMRNEDQTDLFLRCNGILARGQSELEGLSESGDLLDQYIGLQNIAQQSDAATQPNRAEQAVSNRVTSISSQLRSRQFASVGQARPVLMASNDPSAIPDMSASPRSALDGFLTFGYFDGEQNTTVDELGFEQDGYWVSGGLDYAFSDTFVVGAAATYNDSSADFDAVGSLTSGGGMESESWSVSAYGVYLPTENLEFNGLISFGQADFSNTRRISGTDKNGDGDANIANGETVATIDRTASSESKADTFQITAGGSYAFYLDDGVSLIPDVEVSYYNADIGAFTETGADGLDLAFGDQEVDSLRVSVGGTLNRAFSADWGVLVPYVRARVISELEDDEQNIVVSYAAIQGIQRPDGSPLDSSFVITTNPADELSGDVAIGASAVWTNGFSGFAEYSTVVAFEDVTYNSLTLGLRYEFG